MLDSFRAAASVVNTTILARPPHGTVHCAAPREFEQDAFARNLRKAENSPTARPHHGLVAWRATARQTEY